MQELNRFGPSKWRSSPGIWTSEDCNEDILFMVIVIATEQATWSHILATNYSSQTMAREAQ